MRTRAPSLAATERMLDIWWRCTWTTAYTTSVRHHIIDARPDEHLGACPRAAFLFPPSVLTQLLTRLHTTQSRRHEVTDKLNEFITGRDEDTDRPPRQAAVAAFVVDNVPSASDQLERVQRLCAAGGATPEDVAWPPPCPARVLPAWWSAIAWHHLAVEVWSRISLAGALVDEEFGSDEEGLLPDNVGAPDTLLICPLVLPDDLYPEYWDRLRRTTRSRMSDVQTVLCDVLESFAAEQLAAANASLGDTTTATATTATATTPDAVAEAVEALPTLITALLRDCPMLRLEPPTRPPFQPSTGAEVMGG
jgi:hypothetical protein